MQFMAGRDLRIYENGLVNNCEVVFRILACNLGRYSTARVSRNLPRFGSAEFV